MNNPNLLPRIVATLLLGVAFQLPSHIAQAQGGRGPLPAKARNSIHQLLEQHGKVTREVTLTEDGYVAITKSTDPAITKTLRQHINQMEERLGTGGMVRGWDPAFREFVEHYTDITHRVEAIPHGVKITVQGKTPEAIKVAQNHAKIVSDFAAQGWPAHDAVHPRVVAGDHAESTPAASAKSCSMNGKAATGAEGATKSCCQNGKCKIPTKATPSQQ